MNIVILADSQGLPRAKGWGNIPYHSTYPYLLDRALRRRFGDGAPLVLDRAMRGRTMKHVVRDWEEEVELKSAQVVILHVGGSDCAPRIFLPREQELIGRIPIRRLRNGLLRAEKRYRRRLLQLLPQRVCVPLPRFEKQVGQIVERASREPRRCLIFINIAPPTSHIGFHSPGLLENIARYNQALEKFVDDHHVHLVDLDRLVRERGGPDRLTVDGVHLNTAGHLCLAEQLEGCVLKFLEKGSRS